MPLKHQASTEELPVIPEDSRAELDSITPYATVGIYHTVTIEGNEQYQALSMNTMDPRGTTYMNTLISHDSHHTLNNTLY